MPLNKGQQLTVELDGKIVQAEIVNIRTPVFGPGISGYLIDAQFAGTTNYLPALEFSDREWPRVTQSEVEAQFNRLISRGKHKKKRSISEGIW